MPCSRGHSHTTMKYKPCAMRWTRITTGMMICLANLQMAGQEIASLSKHTVNSQNQKCFTSVFVESPVSDTYVDYGADTMTFGHGPVLKLRGAPERKRMNSMLEFSVTNLDLEYLSKSFLKIYVHARKSGATVTLSAIDQEVSETFMTAQQETKVLSSSTLDGSAYLLFDITRFIKDKNQMDQICFHLSTDSKKVIDITSRESGLSAELILEMCTPDRHMLEPGQKIDDFSEYSIKILPSTLEGKYTIQFVGVREGGYADLMIMNDLGSVVQQRPVNIPRSMVSYHTIDIGNLLPGHYHAVLRKGRIFTKDSFILKPSRAAQTLQVAHN